LKYFVTRPVDSQIGAWASNQSRIITTRKILEMKFDELKRKFADGKVPLPSFWGGFRVVPRTVEFWQGRPSRLHDRIRYSLNEQGKWQRARLAP
jgi:pyridoxamine 5'-phosphate oxidase